MEIFGYTITKTKKKSKPHDRFITKLGPLGKSYQQLRRDHFEAAEAYSAHGRKGQEWVERHSRVSCDVDNEWATVSPLKLNTVGTREELFLCRKINYGNNNNFVRYDPIRFLTGAHLRAFMEQFHTIKHEFKQ